MLFLTPVITSCSQEVRSFVFTCEQSDSLIWAQLSSVVPWVKRESMGLRHAAHSDSASSRSALQDQGRGGGGFPQGNSAQAQLMECMLVGCFRAFQGPATAAVVGLINWNKGTFFELWTGGQTKKEDIWRPHDGWQYFFFPKGRTDLDTFS